MSNALAVEALLDLVRVMEAAATAERAYQQAREVGLTGTSHRHREQPRATEAAAYEQVMSWQDEIGRAQAEVLWHLGQSGEDWSSWLNRHTNLPTVPGTPGLSEPSPRSSHNAG